MQLDIYLNYRRTCEQAFRFYEQQLGGRITGMVAMLRDKFGTSWMLLHQPESPQRP